MIEIGQNFQTYGPSGEKWSELCFNLNWKILAYFFARNIEK